MEKKKIYYGWITVAGCTMIMATAMGIVFNCASLFIKPIAEDLGYSRSAVQMISTVFNIGNMAVSFLAGKIFTENNIVKLMKVSILVMVCCYFMNSMVSSIYLFYLIALINSVCMTLLTTMPISFIINNWFYEKGGLALGLASMGSGIGSAIFSALSGVWLTTMGWRNTYRLLALFVAVIAIPAVFFLVKLRPQDMGLEPYGKKAEGQQAVQNTGMSAKEVRKKPVFWILVVIAG
ncbi:MAG: MFS transporter, partial [Oscillospiraceae bacterium]|nr:MFS transporter [Oscillospiraceae bacterium]